MMLTLEPLSVLIILLKEVVGIDGRIVNTKQPVSVLLIEWSDALELLTFHHIVLLYDFLRNLERLRPIIPAIEKVVLTRFQHL